MSEQNFVGELMNLKVEDDSQGEGTSMEKIKKRDELYDSAIEVVIREGRGSCSLLQRCLGIGYGRAAKLIDFMAEDGVVGEYNGSKAREVIMTMAQWQAMQGIEVEDQDLEDEELVDSEGEEFEGDDEPVAEVQDAEVQDADEEDEEYEEEYEEEEEEYEDYEEEDLV